MVKNQRLFQNFIPVFIVGFTGWILAACGDTRETPILSLPPTATIKETAVADTLQPEIFNPTATAATPVTPTSIAPTAASTATTSLIIPSPTAGTSAKVLMRQAIEDYYKGNYGAALLKMDRVIELEPRLIEAYFRRGSIYAAQVNYSLAIQDFNKAILYEPNYTEAYNERGLVYYNMGEYEKALADFNRVISLEPDFAIAYNNRANIYYADGDLDLALEEYTRSITLDPDRALPYINRANLYVEQSKHGKALQDLDKAIELADEDLGYAYYSRGLLNKEFGDLKAARQDLKKQLTWGMTMQDTNLKNFRLEVVAGSELTASQKAELVALCNRAYDEDVEPLLTTYADPVHVLAYLDGKMVSHALWCTRWLSNDNGPLLRTAFVELVATEPLFKGKGFATRVMRRVAAEITGFDLGALWPNYPEWYGRLGWQMWRGPLFIRTDEGLLLPTPEDIVMVLMLPKTPALNFEGTLSADWREGELW